MGWLRASILLSAFISFSIVGCGGGDNTTKVEFPDVSTLPKPVIMAPTKSKGPEGPTSQGDPSQFSRAN